ncbi:MAG: DUF2155 domain-containing protein [Alphaproteobacteria bacterium]|nr:DUF2155 domain-containing protein [Alphaproteobacteria bacterium]
MSKSPAPRLAALVFCLGFAGVARAQETPSGVLDAAVLQGVDKVTARIFTFEAPVGQAVRFGTLTVLVRACHKRPPTEPPESAAFVQIDDRRGEAPPVRAFSGWMYASSPALSALEHPVYDVWVVDCTKASNTPPGSSG